MRWKGDGNGGGGELFLTVVISHHGRFVLHRNANVAEIIANVRLGA